MPGLSQAHLLPFLYVRDWPASRRFYRDLLGLGWEERAPGWVMIRTATGDACALIDEAKRYETSPVHRAGVYFAVSEDPAPLLATLAQAGVAVVRPLQRFSHGAEAAIADPDGNVLVIHQVAVPRP